MQDSGFNTKDDYFMKYTLMVINFLYYSFIYRLETKNIGIGTNSKKIDTKLKMIDESRV